MDLWVNEIISKLNRNSAEVLFGEHAAKDKNLNVEDIDNVVKTIRIGKIEDNKSTEENKRICFKNYFDTQGQTYFVVVEYYPNFIKIITVNKKKGKY